MQALCATNYKKMKVLAEQKIEIGIPIVIDSVINEYGVVFEDDSNTGYFYAIKLIDGNKPEILDALHIYNVKDLIIKGKANIIKIIWADNDKIAALRVPLKTKLLINT